MNDKIPTFEQMCDPAYRRAELVEDKRGAMWVAFLEMRNIIKPTGISKEYFNKSSSWITQRINGNIVFGEKAKFRPEEYHQLAEAFRDIARRLEAHADEIDAAAMETDD